MTSKDAGVPGSIMSYGKTGFPTLNQGTRRTDKHRRQGHSTSKAAGVMSGNVLYPAVVPRPWGAIS